jgi:FkbM family methyltransferase
MLTRFELQRIPVREKILFRIKNAVRSAAISRADIRATLSSGLTIRLDSYADWIIYNEIFADGEYRGAVELALSNLEQGRRPVFVDLGANVGFFTFYLIDALRRRHVDRFKVKSVEASPSVFRKLQSRVNPQLQPGEDVQLYNGLVGCLSGTGTLFEIGYHGMASTVPRRLSRATVVPYLDLEHVCADAEAIDLLKCDIEGAEEQFLTNWKPVMDKTKVAVFEFHPAKCDTERCKAMLIESGLRHGRALREADGASVELFWR